MKLNEFYRAAIEVGLDADMRGRAGLEQHLRDVAQQYEAMSPAEKLLFDLERLCNPFGDTRIVFGDPNTELKRVIMGIDISGAELLLTAELSRRGRPVSAAIAHHFSAIAGGRGSAYDTAIPQVAMAVEAGVPQTRAWTLVNEAITRMDESSWDLRILQVAEALDMPLATVHSPADSCLDQFIREQIQTEKPRTVDDLLQLFTDWPECQWLIEKARHGPILDEGNVRAPVGKVYSISYGGWSPTVALFGELCKAGVGTFVLVASTDEFRKLANEHGANIIVIPHYPADNLGMNIMLDRIMLDGDLFDIVPVGNFIRYRRP